MLRDYFLEEQKIKQDLPQALRLIKIAPRDKEDYYSFRVLVIISDKETNTSLMANAFLIENSKEDTFQTLFTFRKLFE